MGGSSHSGCTRPTPASAEPERGKRASGSGGERKQALAAGRFFSVSQANRPKTIGGSQPSP